MIGIKNKRIVKSYNPEFTYELISALPYAYYLHSKGLLDKTISGNDTKCLYYFSPEHEIDKTPRSWFNTPKAISIPNIDIHKPTLNTKQFLPPPLKKQYINDRFKFEKETVVICNRYNIEWSKKPINFFSIPTLKKMFDLLKDEFQIIYINIEGRPELYDNAPPIAFGDFELLKKYPDIINIHTLHNICQDLTFNELQLMIFANCEKYITMNGGHACLAAYFGGENILMSKYGTPQTKELRPKINSFYRWYHKFGGQRLVHVPNEIELLERIKLQWVDKEPIANILMRTSGRPNYFKVAMQSIEEQTYKNINVFVATDNNDQYIIPYKVQPLDVIKNNSIPKKFNDKNYGIPFPANLYLNELQNLVKSGVNFILDDDDIYLEKNAIETVMNEYKKGSDLIFWKVQNGNRIIPREQNWEKPPIVCDISGIGFAFNSKYKNDAIWTEWKRADFRVADKLYKIIKNKIFINQILTSTQKAGSGMGLQRDKNNNQMKTSKPEKIQIKFIKDVNSKGQKLKREIGTVVTLPYAHAYQYIRKGIAVVYDENIEKTELENRLKIINLEQETKRLDKIKKELEKRKVAKEKLLAENGKEFKQDILLKGKVEKQEILNKNLTLDKLNVAIKEMSKQEIDKLEVITKEKPKNKSGYFVIWYDKIQEKRFAKWFSNRSKCKKSKENTEFLFSEILTRKQFDKRITVK